MNKFGVANMFKFSLPFYVFLQPIPPNFGTVCVSGKIKSRSGQNLSKNLNFNKFKVEMF